MSETQSVKDLTKLMMFFGKVSEVHIKNIESFPFIYFNDVSKAEIDYSVATTDKNEITLISYNLSLKLDTNDHLEKRFKGIEDAIRMLFWKEAKILIKINGKEAYKSE